MKGVTMLEIDDWNDVEARDRLMDEYGDSEYPFYGTNSEGEDITVHVSHDSITLITYQSNGWIRKNYYNRGDFTVEEMFEGKWS